MPKNEIQKSDQSEWIEVLTLSESIAKAKFAGFISLSVVAMFVIFSLIAKNPIPISFLLLNICALAYYSYQRWQAFSYSKSQIKFLWFRKQITKEISNIESIEITQLLAWFISAKIKFVDGKFISILFPMPWCAPDKSTFFEFIYQRIPPNVKLSVRLLNQHSTTFLFCIAIAIGIVSSLFAGVLGSLVILFLVIPLISFVYFRQTAKFTKPLRGQDYSNIEPVIFFKKSEFWLLFLGVSCSLLIGSSILTMFIVWFLNQNLNGWMYIFSITSLFTGLMPLFHAMDEVIVTEGAIAVKRGRKTFTCFLSDLDLGDPYQSLVGQKFFLHSPTAKLSIYNHKVAGESLHEILKDLKAGKKIVPLYNPDFPGIRLEYNDALD